MKTQIWPKIHIQDCGRRHLEFYNNCGLGPSDIRAANIYLHTEYDANAFIDDRKCKSKMAAAAILNLTKGVILDLSDLQVATIYPVAAILTLTKSVIFGPNDLRMANVYLQSKFGANWLKKWLKYASLLISRMAAVRHIEVVIHQFLTTHNVLLTGCKCKFLQMT